MQVESNGTEAIIDLYMEKPPEIDILNPQGIPVSQFNVFNSKTNALVAFSQSSHDNPGIWTLTLDKNNTNPGMCLVWWLKKSAKLKILSSTLVANLT